MSPCDGRGECEPREFDLGLTYAFSFCAVLPLPSFLSQAQALQLETAGPLRAGAKSSTVLCLQDINPSWEHAAAAHHRCWEGEGAAAQSSGELSWAVETGSRLCFFNKQWDFNAIHLSNPPELGWIRQLWNPFKPKGPCSVF